MALSIFTSPFLSTHNLRFLIMVLHNELVKLVIRTYFDNIRLIKYWSGQFEVYPFCPLPLEDFHTPKGRDFHSPFFSLPFIPLPLPQSNHLPFPEVNDNISRAYLISSPDWRLLWLTILEFGYNRLLKRQWLRREKEPYDSILVETLG